jgi:hypothetical protein
MRLVTDHIVDNDTAPQLEIRVVDAPGAGGANHEYEIVHPGGICLNDEGKNVVGEVTHRISFQNGPIKEFGVNGVTQEALLAVVIDRLRSFQAGPFSCAANGAALQHVEAALNLLQNRTRERIRRGVEGLTKA